MRILVQKFGGTSVANLSCMNNVLKKVLRATGQGYKVVVVLSAMSGETNRLLALSKEWSCTPNMAEQDLLVSTGEQVAVALFSLLLHDAGLSARSLTGFQIPIITTEEYGYSRIKKIHVDVIYEALKDHDVLVVTGFQGVTESGRITTLGRGGSDTSAVAIAAALDSSPCEIYTDVEGIFTTDPNICSSARKLDYIAYDEILEMASMGAKVLQIRSVVFAKRYNVPLYVRSTFSDNEGTFLINEEDIMESLSVSGVAYDKDQAMISVRGISDNARPLIVIFKALSDANIVVDMIVQNIIKDTIDITFSLSKNDIPKTLELMFLLKELLGNPEITHEENLAKVSVVGLGMRNHAGVASTMFCVLAEEGIPILLINTSEIKISCLVSEKYFELAVRSLHEAFSLSQD
ncbi:MAG: aspartate kinase [Desulfovibrionaceae bacterium]